MTATLIYLSMRYQLESHHATYTDNGHLLPRVVVFPSLATYSPLIHPCYRFIDAVVMIDTVAVVVQYVGSEHRLRKISLIKHSRNSVDHTEFYSILQIIVKL